MLDNITFMSEYSPFYELFDSRERIEYNGIQYTPVFKRGELIYYAGQIGNLRLMMFPDKVYLKNSLHKYWHDNNCCDYNFTALRDTINAISDLTGINWYEARVLKLECGCNIITNAFQIVNSFLSLKGKDYLPMHRNCKVYGKTCEFIDYRVKGYNKTYEAKYTSEINWKSTLFRFEIVWNRVRFIEKSLNLKPLQVKHLLKQETLHFLAKDLVDKYEKSIRQEIFNLNNLTPQELRILSVMRVAEIRDELKNNHFHIYKKDKVKYNKIVSKENICGTDDIGKQLSQKFEELIYG